MTIYFNGREKNVAKESSFYLACQTWVALIHLHIPDIIEDQLDSNSNEQSYIYVAILAHSHIAITAA